MWLDAPERFQFSLHNEWASERRQWKFDGIACERKFGEC
jgi:hypothetical protein